MRLKLAAARKRKGWTQEELANRTGVDRSTVGRHEVGLRGWDTSTLANYAAALGVEEWELLGYSHPPDDEIDPATKEAAALIGQLPPHLREAALGTIRALVKGAAATQAP